MKESLPYHLQIPDQVKHPIIISAPHVGTAFPPEVRQHFLPEILAFPMDADWLVHELYRTMAEEFGLIMIWAKYSRYVVDLNRDPRGGQLYNDGRQETSVVPIRSFAGDQIYKEGHEPSVEEITRRTQLYHQPYYEKLEELIAALKAKYGHVLFYDAHSIRRHVPTIRQDPFPDMILGTNNGRSADERLVEAALKQLKSGGYDVRRDEIFKGGYLTRYFGRPETQVHALQLERSWDIYLKDNPRFLDEEKSSHIKKVLKNMMQHLIDTLTCL